MADDTSKTTEQIDVKVAKENPAADTKAAETTNEQQPRTTSVEVKEGDSPHD